MVRNMFYTKQLVIRMWKVSELKISDNYTCDCEKNYGKNCKYPEKYRDGGCK